MYYTIDEYVEFEHIIEKSKFICHMMPVKTKEQGDDFILQIKKKHRNATHNVPVCLIGENYEYQMYSDDNEPSSTAGLPILECLKKKRISDISVVVTRYFGGIKLGTGGLVRAYTSSVLLALENTNIKKIDKYYQVLLKYEYNYDGKINFLLGTYFHKILSKDYYEKIHLKLILNIEDYMDIEKKIIDITSNNVTIDDKEIIEYMI